MVAIAGRKYELGDVVLAGSTVLIGASVVLSGSVLPWFSLVALGTTVKESGSGFFGPIALLCALVAVAASAALRFWNWSVPGLPFKATLVPLVFAVFVPVTVLFAGVFETAGGDVGYSRALGFQVALIAALGVLGGAVLNLLRDPDPLVL